MLQICHISTISTIMSQPIITCIIHTSLPRGDGRKEREAHSDETAWDKVWLFSFFWVKRGLTHTLHIDLADTM